jgi:Zinc finger C-x8-C-x5-C-x3-H type (and similar)
MASMLRHIEKCRCGTDCPIPLCAVLKANGDNETFTVLWRNHQWIQFHLPSVRDDYLHLPHYAKCREVIHSWEMDNPISLPYQHGCYCAAIKQCMRRMAQYIPQQPLSLQLLATCAIPNISPHLVNLHPDGHDVLLMYAMSQRVQKWWRANLQRRGLYRIKVCKYYKMRGWVACRYGVHCRFAHGRHDIRPKFCSFGTRLGIK